jgi:BirA family biotin operon repressor/biotin-[acetyl-CoA-carboxylase] ligase
MTEALDGERIAESVNPALRSRLRRVTVLAEVDSTNSALHRLSAAEQHGHAILAECQTLGRGRRQRHWHSPAGGNIYMSLGWRFEREDLVLSNLPLLAALSVASALSRIGLEGHGIKWPNDILVAKRKVAGILVELQSAGNAPASAVIGMGINVRMPATQTQDPAKIIDRPWTDLDSHLDAAHHPCSRNRLAVLLLDELLAALPRFEQSGFDAFRQAWNERDLLKGRRIRLQRDGGDVGGIAEGVNEDGGLRLKRDNGTIDVFHSGEVSVFDE